MAETPRSLIINTPYLKPEQHWGDPRNDGSLPIVTERRKAGYEIFDTRNQTRRFVELKQVNKIRKRVDDWRGVGQPLPPVMLTVCNRTETSARVEHYFNKGDCHFQEMHAPQKTLRVDSRILEKAELGGKAGADKDYEARLREIIAAADIQDIKKQALVELKKEEQLRAIVDNVGKRSQAGQDIQNVISVAMLSEGWDAKNVTHIMGLRAFTSQLLCEQVIGRGLRRVAYERDEQGLFLPEYVNIFGVPLSIFQADDDGLPPPPPKSTTQIESLPERLELAIGWPNVLRVETVIKPRLTLNWAAVEPLELKPEITPMQANMAEVLGGKTDLSKLTLIDLEAFEREFRLQSLVFRAARNTLNGLQGAHFNGDRDYLALQKGYATLQLLCDGYLLARSIDTG